MSDKRDEDSAVQQYENAPKASKRSRCCAHLKRFWWLHAIIAVLIILLAVLLTIFVGVKNIAQHKLNNAKLSVEGISVVNTQANNFTMSINSTIRGDGSIKATVQPFDGVMYLEDEPSHEPFVTVRFPTTKNVKSQVVNVTQFIPIENVAALTRFNTWLLDNDTVRVTIKGKTHVKVPGISRLYPVNFKKTITLTGASKFAGMSVDNSSVNPGLFDDGTNFHTTATIPNRSIVTFEIGNITFVNYLNGSLAGQSWLENIILRPGNNTYFYRANITQAPVITGLSTEPDCATGVLTFLLSGRNVTNNGQSLSYFADALASTNSSVDVDLGTPFRKIGLNFTCPTS